jgi:hypothetical protein
LDEPREALKVKVKEKLTILIERPGQSLIRISYALARSYQSSKDHTYIQT